MEKKWDDVLKVYWAEFEKHKEQGEDATVECEIRLGRYERGEFKAEVTPELFQACLAMVQTPQSAWQPSVVTMGLDTFYPTHAKHIRCRTRQHDGQPTKQTVLKTRQCHHDLNIHYQPAQTQVGALRLAVATEMPLADEPSAATVTHVRLKEVHAFTYTSRHFPLRPCLVLECSRVWAGATEAEVRAAQQQWPAGLGLEIELEVLQPLYLLQHPAGPHGGLHGMFLKLLDLYANLHNAKDPRVNNFTVM